MPDQVMSTATVQARLNFAADRRDGGIWSNNYPEKITQVLEAREVEIHDARSLTLPPTLAREGFEFHHFPFEQPAWKDRDWLQQIYVPRSIEMFKELTGASIVLPFYRGAVLFRDTANPAGPGAAEFIHLDNTRASVTPFLEMAADAAFLAKYPHTKIYNIWRVATPPPQDVSLAICDQRTVNEDDFVIGKTVEPNFPDGVPYLSSVYNPSQKWHFISDLTPQDVVVFKGFDSDPTATLGCLHGAFKREELVNHCVPRASTELRLITFSAD